MDEEINSILVIGAIGAGFYFLVKSLEQTTNDLKINPGSNPLKQAWCNTFPATCQAGTVVDPSAQQWITTHTQSDMPPPGVDTSFLYHGTPSGCWPPEAVHITDPSSIWGYSIAPIPTGATYCSDLDSFRAWITGTAGNIPGNPGNGFSPGGASQPPAGGATGTF